MASLYFQVADDAVQMDFHKTLSLSTRPVARF